MIFLIDCTFHTKIPNRKVVVRGQEEMLALSLSVQVLLLFLSKRSHFSLLLLHPVLSLHLPKLQFRSQSLPRLLVCPPRPLECLDALAAFGRPLETGGSSNSPTWLPEILIIITS
jgi:hypothetical protein